MSSLLQIFTDNNYEVVSTEKSVNFGDKITILEKDAIRISLISERGKSFIIFHNTFKETSVDLALLLDEIGMPITDVISNSEIEKIIGEHLSGIENVMNRITPEKVAQKKKLRATRRFPGLV
jgi:hypothetical protein